MPRWTTSRRTATYLSCSAQPPAATPLCSAVCSQSFQIALQGSVQLKKSRQTPRSARPAALPTTIGAPRISGSRLPLVVCHAARAIPGMGDDAHGLGRVGRCGNHRLRSVCATHAFTVRHDARAGLAPPLGIASAARSDAPPYRLSARSDRRNRSCGVRYVRVLALRRHPTKDVPEDRVRPRASFHAQGGGGVESGVDQEAVTRTRRLSSLTAPRGLSGARAGVSIPCVFHTRCRLAPSRACCAPPRSDKIVRRATTTLTAAARRPDIHTASLMARHLRQLIIIQLSTTEHGRWPSAHTRSQEPDRPRHTHTSGARNLNARSPLAICGHKSISTNQGRARVAG
jgi:hypothetical protein